MFCSSVQDAWILNLCLLYFTTPTQRYVFEDSAEITFMHINYIQTVWSAIIKHFHIREAVMRVECMHQKLFANYFEFIMIYCSF